MRHQRLQRKRGLFLLALLPVLAGCLGTSVLEARTERKVLLGKQFFEHGQLIEAQEFFQSFVATYPNDPIGAFYLGRVAFSTERYKQAIEWFTKAVELDERN